MKWLLAPFVFLISLNAFAQSKARVEVLADSLGASFRGLSVPSDQVVWVSGSKGTIGRSVDGGNTWKWMRVPGNETRDFRDIEAFDSNTAVIMAVDNPARIFKTKDGGLTWKLVFEKEQEGMFLDAMEFDGMNGFCIGDPIRSGDTGNYHFYFLHSGDYGDSWETSEKYPELMPKPDSGEAIFAASGSNISIYKAQAFDLAFITGGSVSRLHMFQGSGQRTSTVIPIMQGRASSGAFSLATVGHDKFYITGGDYMEYWKDSANVVYKTGKKWKRSSVHGYRSCIIRLSKRTFLTCGTNGVDISFNRCRSWKLIHGDGKRGTDGFNVAAKSKTGKAVYLAGTGRVARLIY